MTEIILERPVAFDLPRRSNAWKNWRSIYGGCGIPKPSVCSGNDDLLWEKTYHNPVAFLRECVDRA